MLKFLKNLFASRPITLAAKKGKIGEDAAASFLKKNRGMKILRRNFRSGRTEIDLIAIDGQTTVFVEVKTRSKCAKVDGYYAAVSKKKRSAVRRCAFAYMSSLSAKPRTWRFDVVDVVLDDNLSVVSLRHFENARF